MVHYRKNSRYLRLSIADDGQLRLSLPRLYSLKYAKRYVSKHYDWIHKKRRELESTRRFRLLRNGTKLGRYRLAITSNLLNASSVKLKDQTITISLPQVQANQIDNQYTQDEIKRLIKDCLRSKAKQRLIPRAKQLAALHNISLGNIRIKTQRSRWGSFSTKNNLNLNAQLLLLPDPLIDHVILHELAHSKHQGHGADFKRLLNRWDKQAKENAKSLRKQQLL